MTDGEIGGIVGAGVGLAVGAMTIGLAGNMMLKAAKEEGKMFKKRGKKKSKGVSISIPKIEI